MKKNKYVSLSLCLLTLASLILPSACENPSRTEIIPGGTESLQPTYIIEMASESPVFIPDTVPELINILLGDFGDEARILATRKLGQLGKSASPAVPALAINLSNNDHPSDLQEATAWALGEIGPASKPAVPILVTVLLHSETANVRQAAAEALRKIEDKSVLFSLSLALDDDDITVSISAAESMGILANQQFPDMGTNSYHMDDDGVPIIVKSAKDWWREEGRFLDWLYP